MWLAPEMFGTFRNCRWRGQRLLAAIAVLLIAGQFCVAQDSARQAAAPLARCTDLSRTIEVPCFPPIPAATSRTEETTGESLRLFPRHLVRDQKFLWTSPRRMRLRHLGILLPLAAGTAALITADHAIDNNLPSSLTLQHRSQNISDFGVAALAGTAGAAYLWGHVTGNDHLRDTGILGTEAAATTFAITSGVKVLIGRERPLAGRHSGSVRSGGPSFPSEHSSLAWSLATIFARQYPGPASKLLAYSAAAAVSASRVISREHFASDVLVGSALGWFIGREVLASHNTTIDDVQNWGTFERAAENRGRNPANMGSAYVPMDSWVYAAFDRLSGLGYLPSAFAGLKPWTRMECARLLEEARERIEPEGVGSDLEARRLYDALAAEFSFETSARSGASNLEAMVESMYVRATGIQGQPLNDGFHFAQTIINDQGRPYEQGANLVSGFSSRASAGPLTVYVRGEYQHAPTGPGTSAGLQQLIAQLDQTPVLPPESGKATNRFQLLDSYVALTVHNMQVSFGKQSLWWGPSRGGPLMFSTNAEPTVMFRASSVSPFKLPGFLGLLGPMRTDFFVGKLSGHRFPARPYINGQKVSFKPTPNLELGFSKMSVFGGGNVPFTARLLWRSLTGVGRGNETNLPGEDPGDRRGGFDFSYRVPRLRDRLVLYTDSLVDDDPSPLAAPRRAAFNPGIYLTRVPGVPRLDFRAEAAYTDVPAGRSIRGEFIYWNIVYRDSHTNNGNLMGSWVGREGRGIQLWSTYWLSPECSLRIGYRNGRVASDFVPAGGRLDDWSAEGRFPLRSDLALTAFAQYERWRFPALAAANQANFVASFQLTYWPKWRVR